MPSLHHHLPRLVALGLLFLIFIAGCGDDEDAATPLGSLAVRVANVDGPVPGATVTAADELMPLVTDASGTVVFSRIPVGEYLLRVEHPEFGADSRLVNVQADVTRAVEFLLSGRANQAPELERFSPTAGTASFAFGEEIEFGARANDPDGEPVLLKVTSDIDGTLLELSAEEVPAFWDFNLPDLTEGDHLITGELSDPRGGADTVSYRLTVRPPVPAPTGFTAELYGNLVTLNWSAPAEGDVAGYRVTRLYQAFGGDFELRVNGATPETETSTTDEGPVYGQRHGYFVQSVRDVEGESFLKDLSPPSEIIYVSGNERILELERNNFAELKPHPDPDRAFLLQSFGVVQTLDLTTLTLDGEFITSGQNGLAASAERDEIVSVGNNSSLISIHQLSDPANRRTLDLIDLLPVRQDGIPGIRYFGDGRYIITGLHPDFSPAMLNVDQETLTGVRSGFSDNALEVAPEENLIFASSGIGEGGLRSYFLSSGGDSLVLNDVSGYFERGGLVITYDATTNSVYHGNFRFSADRLATVVATYSRTVLDVLPDGRHFVAPDGLYFIETGEQVYGFRESVPANNFLLSPDGKQLTAVYGDFDRGNRIVTIDLPEL